MLTTEEYDGRNGVKSRIVIGAPFNAESRQMADEVLSGKPAEALDKYTGWLDKANRWHKPLPASKANTNQGSSFRDDNVDDIPWDVP